MESDFTLLKSIFFIAVTAQPQDKHRYYPNCHCAPGNNGFICDKSYVNPPSFQAVTSDIVQDVSGDNEETYLLDTTDMYRLDRYVTVVQMYLQIRRLCASYVTQKVTVGEKLDLMSSSV